MTSNKAILEVQEVVMQFGGLRAIDNVSFHVDEAEIFAFTDYAPDKLLPVALFAIYDRK